MIAAVAAAVVLFSEACFAGDERGGAETLTPGRIKRDLEYRVASERFPEFCRHWQQDLRERETHNLAKLEFSVRDGFQTATYTGYGDVEVCEVHQSKDGFAIGKIVYEEFVYYAAGRTREEAVGNEKRPISQTRTTEIFRWEDGTWFQ